MSDTSNKDDGPEVFQTETEKEWGQSTTVGGVDPDLMSARRRAHEEITEEDLAAFSPLLLPFAAMLTGPLVASLLALFCDGDPPTGRQATALVATGATAWLLNMGLAASGDAFMPIHVAGALRLTVLFLSGLALWALYTYWIKGARVVDRSALRRSVVLLILLSMTFWIGRGMDWWAWMGR